MSNEKDTLRGAYPEELIRSGPRGKYVEAYREGTNIVLIDPDLHKLFQGGGSAPAHAEVTIDRDAAADRRQDPVSSWRSRAACGTRPRARPGYPGARTP